MRALSKLINENEPDLVLFVGEALVGNDGVNQLQMFNQVHCNSSWNLRELVDIRLTRRRPAYHTLYLIGEERCLSDEREMPTSCFYLWLVACYLEPHTFLASCLP